MPIDKRSQENIPNNSEAYDEEVASQEEIYLEEIEEEVRPILIFGDPSPSQGEAERSICGTSNECRQIERVDEQLDHAAEELITGDSDDPPLSEEALIEILRTN